MCVCVCVAQHSKACCIWMYMKQETWKRPLSLTPLTNENLKPALKWIVTTEGLKPVPIVKLVQCTYLRFIINILYVMIGGCSWSIDTYRSWDNRNVHGFIPGQGTFVASHTPLSLLLFLSLFRHLNNRVYPIFVAISYMILVGKGSTSLRCTTSIFICLPWQFYSTAFLRSITGGDVQYNTRTKLTMRSKVTSFIRANTCLGTKHMFCETGEAIGSGNRQDKKSVKMRHLEYALTKKEKKKKRQPGKPEVGNLRSLQRSKTHHGLGRAHNWHWWIM